jgi:hypothetical protein
MAYVFKLDTIWIIIFILISAMILLFSTIFIIFIIDYLQIRLNCVCICMGIRLNQRNRYLSIPLFCICRKKNNNTKILPLYSTNEYLNKTKNILIIDPDNKIKLGVIIKNV